MLSFMDNFVRPPKEEFDRIFSELEKIYPHGDDPWGLKLDKSRTFMEFIWPLYKHYFKVRIFGKDHVQDRNYVVIANHSGQIAIDGMLIVTAFVTEISPPRILRPMVERFFTKIPFLASITAEGGAVLGDRQNCLNLLQRKQSVLAFPEGVKGIAKSTPDYYKLQSFTRGFFRLAVTANVEVLPIAVIGAEEFYPYVYQAKKAAKLFGLPALPLTPFLIPLPSPVDIYIGKPYSIPKDLTSDAPDSILDEHISKIQKQIKDLTTEGLKKRRTFWANVIGPKG